MSEPTPRRLERIAAQFARIAACVEERRDDAELADTLRETRALCEWAAQPPSASAELFTNLTTALETWRTVWPRLGRQPEFRQAVAREAGRWARHVAALAKSPAASR